MTTPAGSADSSRMYGVHPRSTTGPSMMYGTQTICFPMRPIKARSKVMNNFEIFVDSAANIPDELIEKNNINVISFTITIVGADV